MAVINTRRFKGIKMTIKMKLNIIAIAFAAIATFCAGHQVPSPNEQSTNQLVDDIHHLGPAPVEQCAACLEHLQDRDGLLSRCAVQLRALQDEVRQVRAWGSEQEAGRKQAELESREYAEAAGKWRGLMWTLWSAGALIVLLLVGYIVARIRGLLP